MQINVYLAGQIHDDWRDTFRAHAVEIGLAVNFLAPMEVHERSDNVGEDILGVQPNPVMKDEVASMMNNLRTRVLVEKADVVIAYFDTSQYRQWNTAMDAGIAIGMGKPLILVRDATKHHALKEISNRAQVTVETPEQALQALQYIFE
ncbi:YtoQ family protein [Limibacter armeniacum]|uniref:YtoQ family protein n=1 Tax=Limibacter armeniacum TaxID=466084 RepID=UPI002FE54C6B